MSEKLHRQSGQVALIVLLIMAVTLVIAVSLARRTSEDIAQTTKQSETSKVFSAAQSGAEQVLTDVLTALRSGGTVPIGTSTLTSINDSSITVNVDAATNFTQSLDEGETYQVAVPAIGSVTVEWGDGTSSDCSTEASLLVAKYTDSGSGTEVEYTGYAPVGCSARGDGFATPNSGTSGRRNKITIPAGPDFVRLMPMYASTDLFVDGATDQQYTITSSAENQAGDNKESRVIEVTTSGYQPPSYLDYTVYSGTTLTK